MIKQLSRCFLNRIMYLLLLSQLFVGTNSSAQTVSGDNININAAGTANSSTNYPSGNLVLTGSAWNANTGAATPMGYQIKNTVSPYSTLLTFEGSQGSFENAFSNHTVRFKGVNMALEVTNDNELMGYRLLSSYSAAILGIRNYSPIGNGSLSPFETKNFFAVNTAGKIGSLDYNAPPGPFVFRNVIDDGSGNMGIGIATPAAQLHTTGTVRFAGLVNNSTAPRVVTADASGNISYRDAASFGGTGNWSVTGSNMYNVNQGFVGIGTNVSPNTGDASLKLAVKGNIYAQKLKISVNGWADYVFAPGYKLRTLNEVETFIQQNQHLPELPSTAEVEKAGIDVGDNQTVLLKKVEELTLYIIQLNKKVTKLEKQINKTASH